MEEFSNNEEPSQSGHIKLKKGFDLNALLDGRGDTFEINFDSVREEPIMDDPNEESTPLDSKVAGLCMGLESDEDEEDLNSTPFEKIALKMTPVTEDGKIKKKITQQGIGETPPCDSMVSIHYSSYLEYADEPTDKSYMKKPYNFRLGHEILFGLNIAVQSMRVNEKALFLIHPDYAFGSMGHPPRIPPNATFLFQIELLRFVDSGPALEFQRLSVDDKKKFQVAHKIALGLMENAKEYFKSNLRLAIREYNKAVSLLEECVLTDMTEQEKQQKLLFTLYSNLAVCYTRDDNARKACSMCNEIYRMAKNTSLKIPAKVYFHNGRALLMLHDYEGAKQKLLQAKKIDPNDGNIAKEILKVAAKQAEYANQERNIAKAAFNYDSKLDKFKLEIRSECNDLVQNNNKTFFKLPNGLTDKEKEIAKSLAENAKLKFIENDKEIIITKEK